MATFNTTSFDAENRTIYTARGVQYILCIPLMMIPVTTVVGNCLVVMAVLRDRKLRTSTNFLLVSLAIADLMVAILVMPFAVYYLVAGFQWYLPHQLCLLFLAGDVSASTASIIHMVAISIDRCYAVVYHIQYRTKRHTHFVYVSIGLCWAFSLALAMPVMWIGLNSDPHFCGIVDPYFMFYGSVFAFFIPCTVLLIMYGFVFNKLRQRFLAIKLQFVQRQTGTSQGIEETTALQNAEHVEAVFRAAYGSTAEFRRNTVFWALPFFFGDENNQNPAADNDSSYSISSQDLDELSSILCQIESTTTSPVFATTSQASDTKQRVSGKDRTAYHSSLTQVETSAGDTLQHSNKRDRIGRRGTTITFPKHDGIEEQIVETEPNDQEPGFRGCTTVPKKTSRRKLPFHRHPLLRRMSTIQSIRSNSGPPFFTRIHKSINKRRNKSVHSAAERIATMRERALELVTGMKSNQGNAIRRETKVTQMVIFVLIAFLICWLPFFTFNIFQAYMTVYKPHLWNSVHDIMFVSFTWLGYLNSTINPLIYSLLNRRFRDAFRRQLFMMFSIFGRHSRGTDASGGTRAVQVKNEKLKELQQKGQNLFTLAIGADIASNSVKSANSPDWRRHHRSLTPQISSPANPMDTPRQKRNPKLPIIGDKPTETFVRQLSSPNIIVSYTPSGRVETTIAPSVTCQD